MPEPTATPPTTPTASETPADWETYLEGQPEAIKALYNTHSEALLNTVRATRTERDALARDIKALAKDQAEGSEARRQLEEVGAKLERAERRASFLEDAAGAQCKNAKAAWLLAEAGQLFDKHGRPDWAAIKSEAPELFGAPAAVANAGSGTNQPPPGKPNMNDFIRRAAGRG
jgi:hypothetical protein